MADTSSYPDISFVETDSETLVNSLITAYEMITGRTLYPADPARLFILWAADIIIQERVLINESAKQNVPRYAEGEYLDSLAEIYKDIRRLEQEAAKTTFRFYLSIPLSFQQLIPVGTRVTVDGEITFETVENLYVKAGELYGDVQAKCQTVGPVGNGFKPGQITQIVDVYPYYQKVENITESAGGTEKESDQAFYRRMRESMESFSTAGPAGAYIYHAKTASSAVKDVAINSPEKGVVDVRVLLDHGELPTDEILREVEAALSSEKTRPLTDYVTVKAPDMVQFDVDVVYYLPEFGVNSATVIASDAENAVQEYINWQTEKMGRDINPSYLISLLMQTGVKRVEVILPQYTKIEQNSVAVLNTYTVTNGGVESE